ncbi:MAG TPA: glycoside hydrolase family 9 protein [Burkholderiaceae bacterium]|nr:glycoside hydrolase family 9 protein [Burkholderiaceae bacterium]
MRVALASAALALTAAPATAAPPSVIRTGGPSAPGDAKVAIVASAQSLAGKRFRVLDASGAVVLSGKLVRAPGVAAPWRRAAQADLSAVTTPGSYRIAVGRLRSRPWVVDERGSADAIAAMLQFFAANSDGDEPSPVHGPSHLNDAMVASGPYGGQRFDLTGGWMDAGDMVKFTQTIAHSAALLQAAARLDPDQADGLNAAADVGVRWLVKAHPRPDLFIGQVGDTRDHDVGFRDPATDDASSDPGIGTRLAYPATGGDLGGKAAVALALAAQRTGSGELLTQAREWYAMGDAAAAPSRGLPGGFYDNAAYVDDMAAGAAELYRATGEQQFLSDALDYLKGAQLDAAFGWDEFGGFAAADICGLLGATALDPGTCSLLGDAGIAARARSRRDAFGMPAAFGWGVTAESAAAGLSGLMAERAGQLPGGARVAAGARDYLLGRNPWGASFIVGYGPRSPRHPHHWASVFGPAKPAGAVVGGPAPMSAVRRQKLKIRRNVFSTSRAFYTDDVNDYVTSEPAIDYTADSILLLAALRGR